MLSNFDTGLLDSLKSAQWSTAGRTFGNSHATLIGLLVQWWIALEPTAHYVLESGPSFAYHRKGIGGGLCDAVFCEGPDAVGILEVEGTRGIYTVQKLEKFFASPMEDLDGLQFAILLLYAYQPVGRGQARTLAPTHTAEIVQEVLRVSSAFPEISIAMITLDKHFERRPLGIRARNEYYWGKVSVINGFLYKHGQEQTSAVLYTNV